ncbi:unnamed protein product [marine sediment metagenome]|uniref:Uncharacterized protein n=1 Tax=marine sediment metagenome TaxID=412755 RepID=X1H045_9ZZZZ
MPLFNAISKAAVEALIAAARATSGTYAGDDAVNRGIPHGLGVIPRAVLMSRISGNLQSFRIMEGHAAILCDAAGAKSTQPVTAPDATNFYVGNAADMEQSANDDAPRTYVWAAIP